MTISQKSYLESKAWPFEEARRIYEKIGKKTPAKGYVLFETGYGPVIKITDRDMVQETGGIRPVSPYVLQPVCTRILADQYEVALFPQLKTQGVKPHHSEMLAYVLVKQGYYFTDNKIANVGLGPRGLPYVLDSDAVRKLGVKDAQVKLPVPHSIKWPASQWRLFPCRVIGSTKMLHAGDCGDWQFSEDYRFIMRRAEAVLAR
jgi:hypothetical protein